MDAKQKVILLLTLLIFSHPDHGSGQLSFDSLIASTDCKDSISCTISFTMPDRSYLNIRSSRGEKYQFSKVQLTCNGMHIPVASLSIRGQSTLYYPKKSFSLKLDKKIDLNTARGVVSLSNCYLISLSMDRNYIHNYLAFILMDILDLFNLAFGYCEVLINDETQGIYLFTERPRDYALKTVGSPAIIRRGFEGKIDNIVVSKDSSTLSKRFYCKEFHSIYTHCRKYTGQALYDSLDARIDIEQYFKWLAFNFMIRNGDYTDEIYLYTDPNDGRFSIIPWDYDDIFSMQPHEGNKTRRTVQGGRLIYSSEDRLDRMIITDEYLYGKYLEQLQDVIETLNDATFARLIRDTYCKVYPYYCDEEIMETTQHDQFGLTNLTELNTSLRNMLDQYLFIRNSVYQELVNLRDHSQLP